MSYKYISPPSDDVDEDPTGTKALWDRGLLNGAAQKMEVVANFHVGETVNTLEVRSRRSTWISKLMNKVSLRWRAFERILINELSR